MRYRSVAGSVIAVLLTVALGSPVALGSTPAAKREIEGLERRRADALRTGEGDTSLFAPDAIDIDSNGHVSLAPDAAVVIPNRGARPDDTASNPAIVTPKRGSRPDSSTDAAIVTSKRGSPADRAPNAAVITPTRSSRPIHTLNALGVHVYGAAAVTTGSQGAIRFVRVWHRTGDRWLIVANQTTPIATTPRPPPIAGGSRHRTAPPLGRSEREAWAATVAVGDAARSRNLKAWTHWVADEFLATSADGGVSTKAERLAALRATASGPTASYEDVRVRVYGGLSVATWTVPGTPNQRLMAIAVKRHGRWQRVAAIATRVRAGGTS